MRILTVANTPLSSTTGSGYVVCGHAAGLRRLGADVEAVGPRDFEPLFPWRRGIRYRQAIGMAGASVRRRADLIEFYGAESWLAIDLLRLRTHRPLIVCHSNGLETHCSDVLSRTGGASPGATTWLRPTLSSLYERAFRRADALVTVSQFDATYALEKKYQDADHILAIENPLPEEFIGLDLNQERGPIVGFCGSWLPIKGIERIRQEIPDFLRRHPDWRLVLVGVGDDFNVSAQFPPDIAARVQPLRARDRRDLIAVYQQIRILIMPSLYEGFGMVASEAMACGCALVASPVGLAAALRPDHEVILVPSRPASLSEALERLALDDELRRHVASGGFARVQRLRWADASSRLFNAYASWLAEHRERGSKLPRNGQR